MIALLALVTWNAVVLTQTKPDMAIRGVVVDAVSGKPAEGVKVTLVKRVPSGQDSVYVQALTDERGAFTLRAPSPGEYTLSASRLPYALGVYPGAAFSSAPQEWFAVSGPKSGIVIKLWESPKVVGKVVDENGQPIADASVRVMQSAVLGGRDVLREKTRAAADARGAYSLQVVLPGTYLVAALPPLTAAGPTRPSQYYLSARTASAATPLQLAASQPAHGIDFHIFRERGFTISGAVEIPAGMPGPDYLRLYDVSGEDLPSDLDVALTTLSKVGTFRFPPLVAGSYEIRLVKYPQLPANAMRTGVVRYTTQQRGPERLAPLAEGPTWWAAKRIDLVDKDVTVLLRPSEGVRVTGRIVFEGAGPKPDRAVLTTRGVYLRSLDYRFFTPVPLGPPNEDGSFRTMAVPPGRYVLGMLDSYDGFQLESVKIGGKEISGVSFDLNRDVDGAVLTFAPRTTAVTGRVAGEPGQTKFVLIWPQDEALWSASGTQLGRIYRAVTADGAYKLPVFPGTYRVVALVGVPPADWESPRYLRSLLRYSEPVTVPAGQIVVYNPTLVPRR